MPLNLDHTIVPAYDKVKSAQFIARILGLEYTGPYGHFAPVKINETFTLDFDNSDNPHSNHYAFLALIINPASMNYLLLILLNSHIAQV